MWWGPAARAALGDVAVIDFGAASGLAGRVCLVTGATGLVGGHLVPALVGMGAQVVALVRDEDPRALVRASPEWGRVIKVRGDVVDGPLLARILHDYAVDTVYHLAAQTQVGVAWRQPLATFEQNVRGTWLLMEAARERRGATRILLASSDKAYGPSDGAPYVEGQPHRPRHPYDTSKSCAEAAALSYHASYGVPLTITRCGNLYGPGDLNFERLVPGTLRSLLRGERPLVRSDGSPVRDFVYVGDAVKAMLALTLGLPAWEGEAFNIGSGQGTTVLEAVVAMAAAARREDLPPVILGEAAEELKAQLLDSARIREAVGWQATTSLSEGLARTLPWYRGLP